jgi:acyl-CoA hydrolase
MRHAQRACVTVAIDSVSFHSPVNVGNLLSLSASLQYVGRTSMEVGVQVHAEDPIEGSVTHSISATFVFVALNADGDPAGVPRLELETDEERQRFRAAERRQKTRVAERRGAD